MKPAPISIQIKKTSTIYDMMERVKTETIQNHGFVVRPTKSEMHALRDGKKDAIKQRKKQFEVTIAGRRYQIRIS